jgi:large subunit ribosomal protein L18
MDAREKERAQARRHRRVRKKVVGTPHRPRLAVYRSNKHIYAQIIDDTSGSTLAFASTLKDANGAASPKDRAKAVGASVALRARESGISRVAFDRGGFRYHGRVRAVAEGAREGGLEL